MKADIKSLNLKELTAFVEGLGEKAFRAKQIYQWLHVKQVTSFDEKSRKSTPALCSMDIWRRMT